MASASLLLGHAPFHIIAMLVKEYLSCRQLFFVKLIRIEAHAPKPSGRRSWDPR